MQHIRVYLRPQLPTVLTELLWRLTMARRLLGKRFVGCCGRYKKGCYFIFHTQNNLVATYFHGKFAFFSVTPRPDLFEFMIFCGVSPSPHHTQTHSTDGNGAAADDPPPHAMLSVLV